MASWRWHGAASSGDERILPHDGQLLLDKTMMPPLRLNRHRERTAPLMTKGSR
jgi:hypothetical protein